MRLDQSTGGRKSKNMCQKKESIYYFQVKVKSLSCVQLLATPWTVAYQASPSMGFSRQEYWSGLPFSYFQGHLQITVWGREL